MNFTINRLSLLENLNYVSYAVSTKVQMPGLTGIKFSIRKDKITLTTNNNEISIQAAITERFNCIDEGDFIVSGKILFELIKKLNSKDVDFMSYDSRTIKLFADKSEYKLTSIDLDSFVEVPFVFSDLKINLDSLNLKQIIKKTTFAISNNESRPILAGISFTTSDNKLEVVATDSYRLARKTINFGFKFPTLRVIVPGKSFDALNKIIEDTEENVEIYCTSTYILFKFKNILFQSRLIDGVFPKLDSLIPNKYLSRITFNKEELISIIDRLSIFANTGANNIIKFSLKNNGMAEFETEENQLGAAKEEIQPISIENDGNYQISISSKYLLDALHAFDDENVHLNFTGEVKPFTITSDKDINLVQLILPLRA